MTIQKINEILKSVSIPAAEFDFKALPKEAAEKLAKEDIYSDGFMLFGADIPSDVKVCIEIADGKVKFFAEEPEGITDEGSAEESAADTNCDETLHEESDAQEAVPSETPAEDAGALEKKNVPLWKWIAAAAAGILLVFAIIAYAKYDKAMQVVDTIGWFEDDSVTIKRFLDSACRDTSWKAKENTITFNGTYREGENEDIYIIFTWEEVGRYVSISVDSAAVNGEYLSNSDISVLVKYLGGDYESFDSARLGWSFLNSIFGQ